MSEHAVCRIVSFFSLCQFCNFCQLRPQLLAVSIDVPQSQVTLRGLTDLTTMFRHTCM